jgi:hypothetical protein
MNKPFVHMRMLCAAAAVLLTGLSSTVFVSAEPRVLERRITAHALAVELDRAQARPMQAAALASTSSPAG